MFGRSTWAILALAVLAAALGGWLQHRSRLAHAPDGVPAIAIGAPAPDVILSDTVGGMHRLSDYRGHRVLVNFWASWCGPCLDEMPALDRAATEHPQAIVLGIAMDEPGRVRTFLRAHPVAYPVWLGSLAPPSTSLRLGNTSEVLPYSVLLDRQGRVLASRRGPLDADTLKRWLDPAGPG
ncbi:TlpA disulfide reductase family protein [Dyella sp.]|jgi:thiol-disulfide isomerase/thioredoxin|uniref:TlpA family protein disulfide reductase n=1 Tax=Dyella sp. TaxID=1869338 RepID=UPI002D770077|nr:TlpA disulfide reductase family protein [Dyella sp.]HET6433443.1 TlpA disulfide reductase family protein [Dyella sp.]